jgi:hypothetical protein
MCIQFLEQFHFCGHSGAVLFRRNCTSQIECNPFPTPIRINWDSFCPACCLKAQFPKTAKSACLNKLQYSLAKDVLNNYAEHMRNDHSEDSLFFWSNSNVDFLCKLGAPDSCLPAICDLWRALNCTLEDFQATGQGAKAFVERFHIQQERFLVQQVRQLILHKFIIALTSPATVFKQEISCKFPSFPCTIAEDDVTRCRIFRLESRVELLEAVDPSSFQHSQLNCKMCESSLDTHNPVRMPCCSRIVGRECIKKDVLGQNPDDCPICPFCWSPFLDVTPPLEEFVEKTNVPNSEKPDLQPEEPWWLRLLQGNLYVVTRMRELTESGWCIESQDDGCTTSWKDSKIDELKRSISTKAKRLQRSISARVITPMKEFVSKEDDEIQDPNPNGFNSEG